MNIKVIPTNFPPDIGGVLEEALVETQRRAGRVAEETVTFLKGITPSRSGFMRSTVKYWSLRVYGRGCFSFWVGWRRSSFGGRPYYPPYVTYGTGIYSGKGMIRPLHSKRLAWQHRGRWVSASQIKGQRPQRLLEQVEQYGRKLIRQNFQNAVIRTMKSKFR